MLESTGFDRSLTTAKRRAEPVHEAAEDDDDREEDGRLATTPLLRDGDLDESDDV